MGTGEERGAETLWTEAGLMGENTIDSRGSGVGDSTGGFGRGVSIISVQEFGDSPPAAWVP